MFYNSWKKLQLVASTALFLERKLKFFTWPQCTVQVSREQSRCAIHAGTWWWQHPGRGRWCSQTRHSWFWQRTSLLCSSSLKCWERRSASVLFRMQSEKFNWLPIQSSICLCCLSPCKTYCKPCLFKNWKKGFSDVQNSEFRYCSLREKKKKTQTQGLKTSCQKFALESGPMPRKT